MDIKDDQSVEQSNFVEKITGEIMDAVSAAEEAGSNGSERNDENDETETII